MMKCQSTYGIIVRKKEKIVNSIGTKYVDYVSYALQSDDNGVPRFSVCLDVKNEKDANKLKLLVHVGFFEYICSILNKKLSNVIRKQDEKKQIKYTDLY